MRGPSALFPRGRVRALRSARHLAWLLVVAGCAFALPATASAAPPEYRVLVFTPRDGDQTSNAGVKAIRDLGRSGGFSVVAATDPELFHADSLARFRAVVFLNTGAADVLSDAQQAAFEDYFSAGGGFLGVGSAIETEPDWPFLTDLLGTRATGQSALAEATIKVADRVHEASKSLPQYWTRTDRWYNFADNVRGESHVLATVDESTYSGGTNGFDHPIAWCKDYQGGRSFYTAGGNTAASFSEPAFRAHLAGAIAWTAGLADPVYSDCGATVLANYQMDFVAAPPNVSEPIGFDVLPDGRVIQTDRRGGVRLHDSQTNTTTVLAQIPVYSHREDGMYGPAVDNEYETNKWVYLFYSPVEMEPPYPATTPDGNAPNTAADPSEWDEWLGYFQLSRFKLVEASGDTPAHLDLESEQRIMKVENNRGACCHVAGDIAFDSKNNLWLVTGDDTPAGGGGSGGFGPFNDMITSSGLFNAPHVDARRSSLNTNDLRGKVLRIKVNEDGSYSIPEGNLFPESEDGDDKTRPEIYAMGFRNPFRISLDSSDVAYVTDYSPDSRVPQNFRGPAGTGRVEIVRKPSNYGWPVCYAPNLPFYRWNFNSQRPLDDPPQQFECNNPTRGPENTSRWNTGRTVTPPITQPDIWYSYNDNAATPLGTPCLASYDGSGGSCPQLFPELGTGGVGPHGAAPYDYDAGNPNDTKFPPYFDGSFILGEFTRDWLREVRLDSQGRIFKINQTLNCGARITAATPFLCDNPMDMEFGEDGNYYLLTYGDGFFNINPDAAMQRFSYVKGLRAPQAVVDATPTSGHAPLTVQFSSEGSRDPDPGESIRFEWDFDGNGTVDSIDPNPSHTYTANGVYTARLTVTDSSGRTAAANTTITVGNTAPTVSVTVPVEGGTFSFGDGIPFQVTVTDPEDDPVDCSRVEVTFVLGHDEHGHAGDTTTGCSGVLETDADDVSHGGNVFGLVSASYTDDPQGSIPALTATDQNPIRQKRQEVEHAVEQEGTNTSATADPDGGGEQRGSLGNGDWIRLNGPFNLVNIDSLTFRVSSAGTAGENRGIVELRRDAVDGPLVDSFTIQSTGSNTVYASQTFPLADPGGLNELFLVFRPVEGGPGNNFFNLNWVQFDGAGISAP
jgi:cytochrome c